MIIYIIGGAEEGQLGEMRTLFKILDNIFTKESFSQILHIPFGKPEDLEYHKQVWNNWFIKNKKINKYEFLSARNELDVLKATNPMIFISGGSNHIGLYNSIVNNKVLYNLILNAKCIVAECSGAMVLGTYFRSTGENCSELINGLGVIPNTIIEPHFLSRDRKNVLSQEIKKAKIKYGIGLSSLRGIKFYLEEFPLINEHIGNNDFMFLENNDL